MPDRLLQLGANGAARAMARTVGLSLPPGLERADGPWGERPLEGREVVVSCGPGSGLTEALAGCLARSGADVRVDGPLGPFLPAAEAWARSARPDDEGRAPWAIVADATGLGDPAALRWLWEAVAPRLGSLRRSGRVVVLGRPSDPGAEPMVNAARRALDGFVRSLARELGRSGATANLLVVPEGAEDRVGGVLPFLLSPRTAYVSGQPWPLGTALPASPPAARPFDGRVALVTGAARGIGEATARVLAREGARVLVHDHPSAKDEAEALAAELGGRALLADLSEVAGRDALVAGVGDRLDVLVQNAGVTRDRTLARMPAEAWDLVLTVNLAAVADLAARLGPALRGGGAMVCLSSIGGIGGNVGQTNYAATKAGVIGLVEAWAPRLAERGVAVAGVAPGFIETRMTAAVPFATREVARRLANVSQGGLPGDVAEVLAFLASPGGRALTGRVLRVCGGNLLGA